MGKFHRLGTTQLLRQVAFYCQANLRQDNLIAKERERASERERETERKRERERELTCSCWMDVSQPQNYQRPLYQRRFIQYCFFAFSLENDRGLTKNDTPEHGLCWTFELELPKSNLCTVPVLKAATCDLEVAASKQKPLRLTRDRRKLRPSS